MAALLLCLAVPKRVSAQDNPPPTRPTFWGFVALGIGAAADSSFYAAGVGGAWQRRSLVLMGRIASVGPEKENRMEDLGLLGRWHAAWAVPLFGGRRSWRGAQSS